MLQQRKCMAMSIAVDRESRYRPQYKQALNRWPIRFSNKLWTSSFRLDHSPTHLTLTASLINKLSYDLASYWWFL